MKKSKKERILYTINSFLVILFLILIFILLSEKNPEIFDEEFYVKVIDPENNESFYAVCFSWSQCFENNTMMRNCYPIENLSHKLIQTKACNYQEVIHCTNGIRDFDETDIDCGGSCKSCELYQKCGTNNDCKSANCHPVLKECVNNEEMPNFFIRIIFAHPLLMFIILVILPASLLYLWWLKANLRENKIKADKRNKELLSQFEEYAKSFRDNVKNGNSEVAKEIFLEINRILSELSDDALKKVLKEYESLKKIYTKINSSNRKIEDT